MSAFHIKFYHHDIRIFIFIHSEFFNIHVFPTHVILDGTRRTTRLDFHKHARTSECWISIGLLPGLMFWGHVGLINMASAFVAIFSPTPFLSYGIKALSYSFKQAKKYNKINVTSNYTKDMWQWSLHAGTKFLEIGLTFYSFLMIVIIKHGEYPWEC